MQHCEVCQRANGAIFNVGLYASLPIPNNVWKDLGMDFILDLSRIPRGKNSILVVVDKLSK